MSIFSMNSSRYMQVARPTVWPMFVGAMYLFFCCFFLVNRESGDSPVTSSSVACFQD